MVTGASGFIGPHMCRRLQGLGAEVHAVARRSPRGEIECRRLWKVDLADTKETHKLIREIRPEVTFHLSGLANGRRDLNLVLPTLQSNFLTAVNILIAVADVGCGRIVVVGSLEEPDSSDVSAVPSSPYAASKWASSAYARMFAELYGSAIIMVRLFMTYGPGEHNPEKLIPYVITSLLKGEPPRLSSGERKIDWIFVEDAVEGIIMAGERGELWDEPVDIGSGELTATKDMVKRLAGMIRTDVEPSFGSLPERPMEQVRAADVKTTFEKIGWKPRTTLDEGLQRTVEWYRSLSAA